jgi:hypothetical protein
MRGFAKFWVVLVVLVLAVALTLGCRDDVVVPEPPTINGHYSGIYSLLKINLNSLDTTIDTSQAVDCTFKDGDFTMDKSGTVDEADRVFCDIEATYVLTNGVEITVTDSNYTRGVCTQEWCPAGYFGLDQTTDTMRLLHDVSEDSIRWVKLLKLVNATI